MKICPLGATWMNRHDNLTDAFCNFVNAPKNSNYTTKI